jgi:2',3'-cyclic-nucleotide 2'-phosphodiesterase (5'-nucleotidase family)
VVLVDCGDTFTGDENHPRLRADAVLSGMKLMGYDAVNIAEGELSMGAAYFSQLAKEKKMSFVSANIAVSGMSPPVVSPYVIKSFDGFKVGITGVSPLAFFNQSKVNMDGVAVEDPLKRLKEVLADLRTKVDLVILLSHLSYDGTKNLLTLNALEGVDVVIAGHGRKLLSRPEMIGKTVLVQNSMIGEFLGKLKVHIGENGRLSGIEGSLIELTEDMPSNADAFAIIQTFLSEKVHEDERLREEREKKKVSAETRDMLKMSPKEFYEMMQKKNAEEISKTGLPARVPLDAQGNEK